MLCSCPLWGWGEFLGAPWHKPSRPVEVYHQVGTEQCPGPAPAQGEGSHQCPLQCPWELSRGWSPFSPEEAISGSMGSSHYHSFPTGIQKTNYCAPAHSSVVVFKISHKLPLVLWISMWYEGVYGDKRICTDLSQKFTHRFGRQENIVDINDFFSGKVYHATSNSWREARLLQLYVPRSKQ